MKKSNKKPVVVHKTSLSNQEGLEVLADIHNAMTEMNRQMAEFAEHEDTKSYEDAKAEFDRLAAQFNYFVAQLPPVKFDDKQGVYYVGKDEATGLEVFRNADYKEYAEITLEEGKAVEAAWNEAHPLPEPSEESSASDQPANEGKEAEV